MMEVEKEASLFLKDMFLGPPGRDQAGVSGCMSSVSSWAGTRRHA